MDRYRHPQIPLQKSAHNSGNDMRMMRKRSKNKKYMSDLKILTTKQQYIINSAHKS
jgi:hypothetical protein